MSDHPPGYGIVAPSYRLPATTHVGPVRLQVADVSRSIEYYTQVLGLRVSQSNGAQAQLTADAEGTRLVEVVERPGATPMPRQRRLGLFHFALLVPDRASLGRFLRHLAGRGVYAGSADHAVSEALYLTDPDGLGIEVYADRPRAAWRVNGRELFMTTEPLDLRDLVRSAGDEPWTGLPAGTVMGHVHLHVGDLGAATAFYHAGLGLDQIVWSYPGALFLSSGGYHHHLGVNTWAGAAPPARENEARLLQWSLQLPDAAAVEAAAGSLAATGHTTSADGDDRIASDPWGTIVRLRAGDTGLWR
jgi:catechol 2,3-dioxygenase